MRKSVISIRLLIILGLSTLFVGCFEIVEEINVNNDGSGSFALTFNLSQSKTKLQSIMLLDSINGFPVPHKNDINFHIDRIEAIVSSIDSISNIKVDRNFDEFIFSVSLDFEHIEALNKCLGEIEDVYGLKNSTRSKSHFDFSSTSGTYERNGNYIFTNGIKRIATDNSEISETADYISICRFENEVEEVVNEDSKISPNQKAVMIRKHIDEVIKNSDVLDNKIELK